MIEHGEAIAEQFAAPMPLFLDAHRTWAPLEEELGEPLEVHLSCGLMGAGNAIRGITVNGIRRGVE